ncbi:MAG: RecQ family ATP-dependent DNA helicase [Clostridia bacterium]|nr:RecQ family ATP-dependent DNA helicase [Clostridia bacterium]
MNDLIFLDVEANPTNGQIRDFGAVRQDGTVLHTNSPAEFSAFLRGARYLAGHNIVDFDLKYIRGLAEQACPGAQAIDTLYLSALLFPAKPYHRLLKDDKLQTEELNNPLNDAMKCRELFDDEVAAFLNLPEEMQKVYQGLLEEREGFAGFFSLIQEMQPGGPAEAGGAIQESRVQPEGPAGAGEAIQESRIQLIQRLFQGKICEYAKLGPMIRDNPAELAYTLALVNIEDKYSITPPWVIRRFPGVEKTIRQLRGTICGQKDCRFCARRLDAGVRLKEIFGFDSFRVYEGESLQEKAVRAAIAGESLLAVFPTGGGKSLTFQLPALVAGEAVRGLTVVISPLQSLMKDQVDHLEEKGIPDAVTINGLLDPLERKEAIDRVANGRASILYISPESLRSATIENLLASRNVVRFVIDEAHCFSSWGHDFRVDYLYIGDFLRKLQERKNNGQAIPVSCFTATAKQQVIRDIQEYFRQKLGLELKLFTSKASRKNLQYVVLFMRNDEEKYNEIRNLLQARNCPAIIYVSRVRRTQQLAERLRKDGFAAEPYNGRMDSQEKIRIQNAFLQDEVQVIVATSAFGMGVDKPNVGLVIHHDISDSLESYTQEAGRAGRDESLQAECYVLFNEEDLDKHFVLLNQTRLSMNEIQQVWRAIKEQTGRHGRVSCSVLEIGRQAGWDDTVTELETRIKTAIAALEDAGYIERGRNVPHIYANSIQAPNMAAASRILEGCGRMTEDQKMTARRILSFLISRKNTYRGTSETAESRVDYLADRLGLSRKEVVDSILMMREEGLLADEQDLTAILRRTDTENRSEKILQHFLALERFLLYHLEDGEAPDYRELNDTALRSGMADCCVKDLKTIVLYWIISNQLRKGIPEAGERSVLYRTQERSRQRESLDRRSELAAFIVRYLFSHEEGILKQEGQEAAVSFSVKELEDAFNRKARLRFDGFTAVSGEEVQQALLYLSRIQALRIEGGFLVSYNAIQIQRKEQNNRIQYKAKDYQQLKEYYQQKMQQIHIVGEYAHLMDKNTQKALQFVSDYFHMEYPAFLEKYFPDMQRRMEIDRNMTPERYGRLFGGLSELQMEIINENTAPGILVAAGPGSGKTRVLVHKLASLLTMEDIKHEQLLMLTFSRAAATEFKTRLMDLIGNAAYFVEIKTFHSYCFDLLGKIGNLDESGHVVEDATRLILEDRVEPGRITKTVLVIDEAQDMDEKEYELVCALKQKNEGMRIIAVGDDDQNIFTFRGADSRFMKKLADGEGCRCIEMTDNYRSDRRIVDFANAFAGTIHQRMKKTPIRAVSTEDGSVRLLSYTGGHLETPVAEDVAGNPREGSRCVLTATNEEAARVAGLLNRKGIRASLIQSNDGFDLYHLAEIRYFLARLGDGRTLIRAEDWEKARNELKENYGESSMLPLCLNIIDTFQKLNRNLYRSDWEAFLHESRMEDFEQTDGQAVMVSTMHKAKGREFDQVFLMLDGYDFGSDEAKRTVYVALTRAKHELRIHTNTRFMVQLGSQTTEMKKVKETYGLPEEILLPLTHRDVALGFFRTRQIEIREMRCGEELAWRENKLWKKGKGDRAVAQLSAACAGRVKRFENRGYQITSARIRAMVFWKPDDEYPGEIMIILPDLVLTRKDQV